MVDWIHPGSQTTDTRLMALRPGLPRMSQYQKGKTNLDFIEARDSEWQWHQLGPMQVCTSLDTDNYTSTPPLSFLQAGCPSCRPTNSVEALNAKTKVSLLGRFACTWCIVAACCYRCSCRVVSLSDCLCVCVCRQKNCIWRHCVSNAINARHSVC